MRYLWIVVFLVGCSNGGSSDAPGDSANFVPASVTEESILVIVHSGNPRYSQDDLDRWWVETKQCLQLEADPPVIKFTTDTREVCATSNGAIGVYCNNGDGWFIGMNEAWAGIRHEIKHEYIHTIMHQNGDETHKDHNFEGDHYWGCRWN